MALAIFAFMRAWIRLAGRGSLGRGGFWGQAEPIGPDTSET